MKYLIMVLIVSGCASFGGKVRQVSPGMTMDQVKDRLGNPDGFQTVEKDGATYTHFKYINNYCDAWAPTHDRCDTHVIFKNNLVIEKEVVSTSVAPRMQMMSVFVTRR